MSAGIFNWYLLSKLSYMFALFLVYNEFHRDGGHFAAACCMLGEPRSLTFYHA